MEPEDLHGKFEFSATPEHKTNILPLRWFANACNHLSAYALHKGVWHSDYAEYHNKEKISKRGWLWWRLYQILDMPYRWWGTSYRIDWHR